MCTQLWRLSLYYDQLRDSGCNSHIYIRSFLWKISNDFLINIHHHSMREFSLCLSLFLLNILWVCNLFLPTHFQNVFYQPLCFLIDFTPAVENRDAVFCPQFICYKSINFFRCSSNYQRIEKLLTGNISMLLSGFANN